MTTDRRASWAGSRTVQLVACLFLFDVPSGRAQGTYPPPPRLFPVSRDDCYGYIDSAGRTKIPLRFDAAWSFSEGLAVVRTGGRYGYIDTLGTIVIEPRFDHALSFSEGMAVVETLGTRHYIDRAGRKAIELNFDGFPDGFRSGRASASADGVVGYIDRTGTMVIRSPAGSYNPSFSDGLAAVDVEGKWGFIDTTGTVVIAPRFPVGWNRLLNPSFHEGFAAVRVDNKWGYIDRTGRVVIPGRFDEARSFTDGLAAVRVGDRWGYVDTTGTVAIAPQFAEAWDFSEGLAPVRVGDRWGYIDRTGRLAIAAEFDAYYRVGPVGWFAGGIARVRQGEDYGYIDRTGRFVWRAPRPIPSVEPTTCAAIPPQQVTRPSDVGAAAIAAPAAAAAAPFPLTASTTADSSRPILYYEELDGKPVLTGLFLDGRRIAVPADDALTMPVWSPDGAWVAYPTRDSVTQHGALVVLNLRGERRRVFEAHDSVPLHPRWSPDGRLIAALLLPPQDVSDPATVPLVVFGVADEAVRARLAIPVGAVVSRHNQPKIRWSTDGSKILVAGGMGVAVVAGIATGSIDTIAVHATTAEWGANDAVYYFAPDSADSTTGLGALYVRRLADRHGTRLATARQLDSLGLGGITFAPPSRRITLSTDATRLAIWGHRSDSATVRLYAVTAEAPLDVAIPTGAFRLAGMILGLQWGPDGRSIAALVPGEEGLDVRLLDVTTGRWKTLATVREGGAADYYGFGILSLSWTQ